MTNVSSAYLGTSFESRCVSGMAVAQLSVEPVADSRARSVFGLAEGENRGASVILDTLVPHFLDVKVCSCGAATCPGAFRMT